MRSRCWFAVSVVLLASFGQIVAQERPRLLIVDGQNNHDWAAMTPPMKAVLEKDGGFSVDVATTPPRNSPKEAWAKFQPEFANYDVVLSNYNGELWPEAVQRNLEEYVAGGGGLVIIHAANNAFPSWPEWNKMIGLGWRGANYGERLTLADDGAVVRTRKGDGPGAGHGPRHEFNIVARDREHPVMRGMPSEWRHAIDELYHGQRGPAQNMRILATAYSDPQKGGTGAHEPMIWVIPYGKGRVFTTVMGHVGRGDTDLSALRCIGFQTVMVRGCQWADTGDTSYAIPAGFPTASKSSLK